MKRNDLKKKIKELKAKKRAEKSTIDLKDVKLCNVCVGMDFGTKAETVLVTVPIKRKKDSSSNTVDWSQATFTFDELPRDQVFDAWMERAAILKNKEV